MAAVLLAACVAATAPADTMMVLNPAPPGPDGAWLDIDAVGSDLRDVLRLLAKAGGSSVVIDDSIRSRRVDLTLENVSWLQALDLLCRSNGLEWHREGKVVQVARQGILRQTSRLEQAALEAGGGGSNLALVRRPLGWADGATAVEAVRSSLGPQGSVEFDPVAGALVIRDVPGKAGEALASLHRVEPLVTTPVRTRQPLQVFAAICEPTAADLAEILPLVEPLPARLTAGAGIRPHVLVEGAREALRAVFARSRDTLDAIGMAASQDEQVKLDFSFGGNDAQSREAPVLLVSPRVDGSRGVLTARARIARDAESVTRASWHAPSDAVQVLLVDPVPPGGAPRVIVVLLAGSGESG